jgi:DNA-binding PadR family transcriptional regulator
MTPWPNYNRYHRGLSPLHYYLLVALAYRPLHTYALAQQIASDSEGNVVPARRSVKHATEALLYWGFIDADTTIAIITGGGGQRGSTYTLTSDGQRRLQRETEHLERAARIGKIGLQQHERRHNPADQQTPPDFFATMSHK